MKIEQIAANLDSTLDELRQFVVAQRKAYGTIKNPAIDYPGFLAFKLSCNRRDAMKLEKWATQPKGAQR